MQKTCQELIALLLVSCCLAGSTTYMARAKQQSQESGSESEALPIPPELRKLDALVGDWSGTIHSNQGETNQAHSKLEASFRWILDGYCLEGVLRHKLRNRPYEARVLWSYDPFAKRYRLYWINNFSSVPTAYSGRPQEGNVLVVSGNPAQGGARTVETVRLVFTKERLQLNVTSQVPGAEVRAEDVLQVERKK